MYIDFPLGVLNIAGQYKECLSRISVYLYANAYVVIALMAEMQDF